MRSSFTPKEAEFVRSQEVLRFCTTNPSGTIHSVPVCFAFDGSNFFVHMRRPNAKRYRNLRRGSKVSLELDEYTGNWADNRGVLVYGMGEIISSGLGKNHEEAVALLKAKYTEYREGPMVLPKDVSVVKITPEGIASWYINDSGPTTKTTTHTR